ncbi:MAG TPA: T9SS type A sorting domain-containing protein [Bacteroidia bacterium]|nr:T9SS type A sorting domain-containing protein [Bacteroidia bacterium]
MKKIYTLILLTVFIFPLENSFAQCTGGRYTSPVFSSDSVVSNIQYGSNVTYLNNPQNLLLDVYKPSGDTASVRPLIVIAHGGSFLFGSKTGTDVVPFCHDFAKMGYVVASIDYRLGIAGIPLPGPDSVGATEAVIRGVHDGKAAVRYFRKSAAQGNPYRVDTSHIYFAGVSAGAFIAIHMAYLDDMSEYPSWVDSTHAGLSGGLEGNSGNPGYSSDVNAIVNICGAIRDTAWIHAGDEPICSFHGTNDGTVPYGSTMLYLLGSYPMLQVDGSFSITAKVNELGIENCFEIYEGQDHVPHVSNPQYYDTTMVIMRNFLSHYVCGYPLDCSYSNMVGIAEPSASFAEVMIYPNPASGNVTVDLSSVPMDEQGRTINLFDNLGRKVKNISGIFSEKLVVNCGDLAKGIYFVEVSSANHRVYSKLMIE